MVPPQKPSATGHGAAPSSHGVVASGVSSADQEQAAIRSLTPWHQGKPQYERLGELGSGSYGTAYVAKHPESMDSVAMKVSNITSDGTWSKSRASSVYRECAVAKVMSATPGDQHVIRMMEAFFDEDQQRVHTIWDLCDRNLQQHLQHYRCITDSMSRAIMQGILRGLAWMSQQGILHNDLKPANVLLRLVDHRGLMQWVVQLADFGSACCAAVPMEACVVTTLEYAAPEVVKALQLMKDLEHGMGGMSEHGGPLWYSPLSDIWSAGVILAELFSDRPEQLQVCIDKEAVAKKGPNAEVDAYLVAIQAMLAGINMLLCIHREEASGIMLVQQMLHMEPTQRPSASDALQHGWFQALNASTPELTVHRSTARKRMLEISHAVARAWILLAGIRGVAGVPWMVEQLLEAPELLIGSSAEFADFAATLAKKHAQKTASMPDKYWSAHQEGRHKFSSGGATCFAHVHPLTPNYNFTSPLPARHGCSSKLGGPWFVGGLSSKPSLCSWVVCCFYSHSFV